MSTNFIPDLNYYKQYLSRYYNYLLPDELIKEHYYKVILKDELF